MFRSLRGKLTFSHVFLAVLILFIAIVLVAAVVTQATRTLNLEQARLRLLTVAARIQNLEPLIGRTPMLRNRLSTEASRIGGRLLLVSSRGEVLFDSESILEGEMVSLTAPAQRWPRLPSNVQRVRLSSSGIHFAVYVRLKATAANPKPPYLAVAVPQNQTNPTWTELFRPLLLVGVGLLLIATTMGFVIARSITHPLEEITRAAEAMAAGSYGQRVEVHGNDEVARLARSFSDMSGRVARSQQAQRDLLANVSHDLKTPLTSIQGFSQAILEGAVTDDTGYRRAAEIIKNEAERMLMLVQDLLDLARLEAHELDLSAGAISIPDLVQGLVAQARPRAEQHNTMLELIVAQSIPLITADPIRLAQVISNLLDNAIKYSDGPDPVIVRVMHLTNAMPCPKYLAVHLGPDWAGQSWVGVSVWNRCNPIPRQELERIFERFYRGDRSRRYSEGSGLGLAIVREAVAAHQGIVEASSTAGAGTEFRIWLPAAGPRQRLNTA